MIRASDDVQVIEDFFSGMTISRIQCRRFFLVSIFSEDTYVLFLRHSSDLLAIRKPLSGQVLRGVYSKPVSD